MRTDTWLARLVRTISRQTPAYQRVGSRGLNRYSRLRPERREAHGDVDRQLVVDVARSVISVVAPRELATFRPVSDAYFADPRRMLAGSGRAGRAPFTDRGQAVPRWTPVVLATVTEVGRYLAQEVTGTEPRSAIWHVLRVGSSDHGESSVPEQELSPALQVAIRRIVADTVRHSPLARHENAASRIYEALLRGDDRDGAR